MRYCEAQLRPGLAFGAALASDGCSFKPMAMRLQTDVNTPLR
jgi:hypothetical protein